MSEVIGTAVPEPLFPAKSFHTASTAKRPACKQRRELLGTQGPDATAADEASPSWAGVRAATAIGAPPVGNALVSPTEANRPDDSPTPQYFSRHYYDVAMLLDTAEGQEAAVDFDMLAQVARHKAVYFRSSWASYDTARPGTLRLIPAQHRLKDLRADYLAMQAMMFDEKPYSFDEILARIEKLQATINTHVPAADTPK